MNYTIYSFQGQAENYLPEYNPAKIIFNIYQQKRGFDCYISRNSPHAKQLFKGVKNEKENFNSNFSCFNGFRIRRLYGGL